jgi:hypothetical protein
MTHTLRPATDPQCQEEERNPERTVRVALEPSMAMDHMAYEATEKWL